MSGKMENGGGRGGDQKGVKGKGEIRGDAESKESLFSYWECLKLVFRLKTRSQWRGKQYS